MKNGTTRKAAPTQYGIELPNFQYSRPPMTGPIARLSEPSERNTPSDRPCRSAGV